MLSKIHDLIYAKPGIIEHRFKNQQSGFTLIELLIVFGVISLITSLGFISLRDFSENQELSDATKNLVAALSQARSNAQTQIKPTSSPACADTPLQGYQLEFQCGSLTCSGYEIKPVCGGTPRETIVQRSFPIHIQVTPEVRSVTFETLTGNVSLPSPKTEITLTGKKSSSVITVYRDGRIVSEN
jgi:prepilin-type N-terminal cleavage/methylation domain-containing protein